jgi:protein-S-isoprenylcysteine O-methyltransferase Ste14
MPGVALVLWAVFGLLAVAGRVGIQLWRTGTSGVSGVSGDAGSIEWLGGSMFVASVGAGIAAPALQIADVVAPVDALSSTGAEIAGLVLFAAGLAITFGAQLAMGTSWRIGVDPEERTELVTTGPFALVRNPIYSGMIPAVAGLTLLNPNPLALVALAGLVSALELQVRAVEEPHLLRSHGEVYAAYAARVGRFVPGLGKLSRS